MKVHAAENISFFLPPKKVAVHRKKVNEVKEIRIIASAGIKKEGR